MHRGEQDAAKATTQMAPTGGDHVNSGEGEGGGVARVSVAATMRQVLGDGVVSIT